jgi:hypothetical protein
MIGLYTDFSSLSFAHVAVFRPPIYSPKRSVTTIAAKYSVIDFEFVGHLPFIIVANLAKFQPNTMRVRFHTQTGGPETSIVMVPCYASQFFPMFHASRAAHIADLIDDLTGLYLAQVADLREFAQTTEAAEEPRISNRPSVRGRSGGRSLPPVRAGRLLIVPDSGDRSQRARSARGQLMHPFRRRASHHLDVPVAPTRLLYKEVPELPRSPWADSPQRLSLGLGETSQNLPADDEVSG